ncbi:hypothetical protein LDC_0057 [sediment metagenome]|uniref:Uncharacterized protein n=1 Tax=sediment metagenome TaxID=749907 RepID=D9PEX9_9ZZZZ
MYHDRLKKDAQEFKIFVKQLKKMTGGVAQPLTVYNPKLLEAFEGKNPVKELEGLEKRYLSGSFDTKETFQKEVDNTMEQEHRIRRLYGDLPQLNGIDATKRTFIDELKKMTGGKFSYYRYTFKFYPAILTFLEKLVKIVDEMCVEPGKIRIPQPEEKIAKPGTVTQLPSGAAVKQLPSGRAGLRLLPPHEEEKLVNTHDELMRTLESEDRKDVKNLAGDVERLKGLIINKDLAAALKLLKREIARGKNPLFKDMYRVPVREDMMQGNIYRPYRFEIVAFGNRFMGPAGLDKGGRRVPSGVGGEAFAREIFLKLNYVQADKNAKPRSITTELTDVIGAMIYSIMFRSTKLRKDIEKLNDESSKFPDKESVALIDRMIVTLANERAALENTKKTLTDLEKEAREMQSMSHQYIKDFIENMKEVAKTQVDWGSGEWGEDDGGVDNFVPALHKFRDVPDMLEMILVEAVKEGTAVIRLTEQSFMERRKLNDEWKKHIEEVMKRPQQYAAAA